ncbi:glycosyltransferase [Runella aurantiaca]|uniref:Glycosyl transferase family 28 C-terminal domain-containing protein n=1 Tax=Runella aurantiaca TaxID=2282308 RepID=A0A369I8X9_9BACT|nr:glycosyltransferase [Runella aurantiaca]RDB03973.1 hypothetical protein DVG78_20545 [Runella aurantiaca]
MKPRVLILPAAIRSHVLPSLYLADLLADEYEVYYAVTSQVLAEIVVKNGYQAVKNSGYRIGYHMETSFLASKKQKLTYWRLLKAYRTDELYWERKRELDALIDEIRPSAILIDLFVCTDFWVLNPRRSEFKLLFFNPMPSTYRVRDWPSVPDRYLIPRGVPSQPLLHLEKKRKKSPSPTWRGVGVRYWLIQWTIARHRQRIQQLAEALPDYPLALNATVTQVIANVPELILAPLEFEFAPEIRKPNQHYLGLCMREHRQDTELDPVFEQAWEHIVNLRLQQNKVPPLKRDLGRAAVAERLIYCSFGTFHEGADATLLRFVTNLLAVVNELPNVRLVCSVNKYVIETLRARKLLTDRTHFFSRVPQLRVLATADVFITHAGFGSIKESIYYGVPMLAYPLDPHYDQNGNALKIEYHGLGLRGAFAHERVGDLKKKLERLLEEKTFREKVRQFREVIVDEYKEEKIKGAVQSLLVDKYSAVLA